MRSRVARQGAFARTGCGARPTTSSTRQAVGTGETAIGPLISIFLKRKTRRRGLFAACQLALGVPAVSRTAGTFKIVFQKNIYYPDTPKTATAVTPWARVTGSSEASSLTGGPPPRENSIHIRDCPRAGIAPPCADVEEVGPKTLSEVSGAAPAPPGPLDAAAREGTPGPRRGIGTPRRGHSITPHQQEQSRGGRSPVDPAGIA